MSESQGFFRKKTIDRILQDSASRSGSHSLFRTLRMRDLTAMGIAAIIGAGIFSTIGNASFSGGPAVILLFVFTAIACAFSAMSYAEFASGIPVAGSAYTYAYASFGEVVAWIIGWALIVEYAIGNIVVAISWSDYFTGLLDSLGVHVPACFSMDYLSAKRGFMEAQSMLARSETLDAVHQEAVRAWTTAPEWLGFKWIADIPALTIVFLITALIYRGVHETRNASNLFVVIKLFVIVLIIVVGAFYINPENWKPFAPNGMQGVLKGVSSVFFAYIGFDALATTAEECKDPRKDLPKAMIASLTICTVLYILIALTLTGIVSYKELAVGDPLAHVFDLMNVKWLSGLIAVSAIFAMASVLLVFQNGQPRIWMSMSRDGLLPPAFSKIHPQFKTPHFSTIITGILVAIPALFMNLKEVTDLSSIGTLFAFIVVNAGVIRMESHKNEYHTGFRVPYINGKVIVPLMYLIVLFFFIVFSNESFFSYEGWIHKLPMILFLVVGLLISIRTFLYNYSLIPVLGLLSNLYLMSELGISNWIGFTVWLLIGLIIYFGYGRKHSKLNEGLI